jgi:hypothetical protein
MLAKRTQLAVMILRARVMQVTPVDAADP